MWKSNLLSEAAMSQTVLHQHDNPRNYITFLYLLDVKQFDSLLLHSINYFSTSLSILEEKSAQNLSIGI